MKEQTTENKPTAVEGAGKAQPFPKQVGEAPGLRSWVERSVWTKRLLNRLAESQESARVLQPGESPSKMDSIPNGKPPTGKLSARNWPAQFGGRGSVKPALPTPINV